MVRIPSTIDRTPDGSKWTPWTIVPISVTGKDEESNETKLVKSTFGIVPSFIVPATTFQETVIASHCGDFPLPWNEGLIDDPSLYSSLGGFTLGGVMAGLAAYEIVHGSEPRTFSYDFSHPLSPKISICVGNVFLERTYSSINGFKGISFSPSFFEWENEIYQNEVIKRYYLHHGEIRGIYKGQTDNDITEGEMALDLGIESEIPDEYMDTSCYIEITSSSGKSSSHKINRFLKNGRAVIGADESSGFTNGDFYMLDKVIVLEDPLLMGGFFRDKEDHEINSENGDKSDFNLFVTKNQKAYVKFKFVGGYAYQNSDGKNFIPSVGQSMNDNGDFTWAWHFIKDNNTSSYCYGNEEDRVKTDYSVSEENDRETGGLKDYSSFSQFQSENTIRKKCEIEDVKYGVDNGADHVRVEIEKCGSETLNNFHAPILKSAFLKQNDKFFKILDHVDAATIDVSWTSVDGSVKLDLKDEVEILNHYAWKITEHYNDKSSLIFGYGNVKEISGNVATIELKLKDIGSSTYEIPTDGPNEERSVKYLYEPLIADEEGCTYLKRFLEDIPVQEVEGDDKIRMYKKFKDWSLHLKIYETGNRVKTSRFSINNIRISGITSGDDAVITLDIETNGQNISEEYIGETSEIFFDIPYMPDTMSRLPRYFLPQLPESHTEGYGEPLFTGSEKSSLCLDGATQSPILNKSISKTTCVGVCENTFFTLGTMFIGKTAVFMRSKKGIPSTSSIITHVPQAEMVAYKDKQTNRVTIRSGSVDFSSNPIKEEISIGKNIIEDTSSDDGIKLNGDYERVSCIRFTDLPTTDTKLSDAKDGEQENPAVFFGMGNIENYYGNIISGNGSFYLYPFLVSGQIYDDPDNPRFVSSSNYKYNGLVCSPVFVFASGADRKAKNGYVSIGASTDESPIIPSLNGEAVSIGSVSVAYVNNNQTIDSDPFILHQMRDNRYLFIYNKVIDYEIKIGDELFSGFKYSSNCIMAIMSEKLNRLWGSPYDVIRDGEEDWWGIPIMLAQSCELLEACFDDDRILIFAKCFQENGDSFIGIFKINERDLNKNLVFSQHSDLDISKEDVTPEKYVDYDIPFWFRKFGSETVPYTPEENMLDPTVESSTEGLTRDSFTYLIGKNPPTNAVKTSLSDIGIISCHKYETGAMVLFYNNEEGLTFLVSQHGHAWLEPKIIISNEGVCGFSIDDYGMYYLVPGRGICMKEVTFEYIERLLKEGREGNLESIAEIIQEEVSEKREFVLGTGDLSPQKFSGYVNDNGVYRIFYYEDSGTLSCVQSVDKKTWYSAENF